MNATPSHHNRIENASNFIRKTSGRLEEKKARMVVSALRIEAAADLAPVRGSVFEVGEGAGHQLEDAFRVYTSLLSTALAALLERSV